VKECYFPLRINTLNQTFFEMGENSQSFCFLSNDIQIEKNSREHINFILMFLNTEYCKKAKHVIIWSDNCTSQNRNWSLFANLVKILNDKNIVQEKITLKYLEVGHTYMSCDSLHGIISRKFDREHEVYTPDHCLDLIKNCRKNNYVEEVRFSDIVLFNDESKNKKPFTLKNLKAI